MAALADDKALNAWGMVDEALDDAAKGSDAPKILAVIPARSGSKGVPHKNIRRVGPSNMPLMGFSVKHALESHLVTRVIVSTDSEEYQEVARECGAEAPFIRPAEISGDLATDLQAFEHALAWLKEHEGYVPDIVVQLRPTAPIRDPAHIDAMCQMLLDDESLDSVRSIVPVLHPPYKTWFMHPTAAGKEGEGLLQPVVTTDPAGNEIPECYNMPRQALPKTYLHNGNIDVFRARVITEMNSMSGKRIAGYEVPATVDIDTEDEMQLAAQLLEKVQARRRSSRGC